MICPVEIANNNEISLDVCPGDSRSDQIATDGAVLLHGDIDPGYRTVEPQTIAYNEANHLALGAWCVSAADASHQEQGWREYLLRNEPGYGFAGIFLWISSRLSV